MMAILVFGVVIIACPWSRGPASVNVNPYDPDNAPPETRYCKYTIESVSGSGGHQVGDTICIVCEYECPLERVMVPEEGIEYFLKKDDPVTCVTCNGVDLDKFYESR
jgi:hypothetical protein